MVNTPTLPVLLFEVVIVFPFRFVPVKFVTSSSMITSTQLIKVIFEQRDPTLHPEHPDKLTPSQLSNTLLLSELMIATLAESSPSEL